ncbi:MAG: MBL fold metallo-hydrolase [Bacteroidota bacterium]
MPLSRRAFVARSATVAAALPFLSPLALAGGRDEFTAIREGVGVFTGRGGTIAYLQAPEALVAVDTQFPASAQSFLDGLRQRSGDASRGLDLLVNTHHHGDHTAGNAVLAPLAATHVAHEAVPGLQRASASRSGRLDSQRYPSTLFRRSWSMDLGGEVVSLRYFGPAHTAGDAVVHFERADVVHMGDLVFNRRQPFIDRGGGARVDGWIALLESVHDLHSDDTVFVFGHAGEAFPVLGDRSDLLAMRDFLSALRDAASTLDGDTVADRVASLEGTVFDGLDDWGPVASRVASAIVDEYARPN